MDPDDNEGQLIVADASSLIYTKTGDDGTTGRLFGGRLAKDDLLIEACGDVDEAVAALGVARAQLSTNPELSVLVLELQRDLFIVAADLMANPHARQRLVSGISLVESTMTSRIEAHIDRLIEQEPLRPVFIVPGATEPSAALDFARTVTRRAERHTIRAARTHSSVSSAVVMYLNRVSDLLYVLARRAAEGSDESASHL